MTPPTLDRLRRIANKDQKTRVQAALKIGEELGELYQLVLIVDGAHGTAYRDPVTLDRLAEEMADVLICAIALAEKLEISDALLEHWLRKKMDKWESVL